MRDVDLRVYFIMGSFNAPNGDPLHVLEQALKGGITCFQLREKGPDALTGDEKTAFAKSCQRLCKAYGVPFIVNDDVELAVLIDADGVHVGQDDLSASVVRRNIGEQKLLGVSVHSVFEATSALAAGADYIGMGPVYETVSKSDAKPVAGTARISEVAAIFPELPIVGIGGITASNLDIVMNSGATGVSIISAISGAENPEAAARSLLDAVQRVKVGI
ncbi:thiamine phosphate synthase [Sporosarcina gallistercoris]|uniref:Thiamine-phosphate synthase n=1 Tax=Sporosarcina gallistercoris TaxID=2762245 RepID=A0ABR8PHD3_9BACL|nr:thiamine phosphate synthase [Sporosarcina gallistercoris]MBD7907580.1 thiamine phosphate synthase [Sporosarcina gallistercoris]